MSGNLDKILEDMRKRTSKDMEKLERETKEKQASLMGRRNFLQG
jgi:predicted DNA-binding transcriptional regulator